MNDAEHDNTAGDPGLRAIAERLNALGARDEGAAPEGLESRVLGKVGAVFTPAPIAIETRRPAWWRRPAVRAAAGVAVLGGVSALVLVRPGLGVTQPSPRAGVVSVALVEQRIEGLLAMTGETDGFGDQVASIELWADALGAEAGGSWAGSAGDPVLGEGAL